MQYHGVKSGLEVFISVCILAIITGSTAQKRRGATGFALLRLGKRNSVSSLRMPKDLPMLHEGGRRSSPEDQSYTSPRGARPFRVSDQLLAVLTDAMEQTESRDETRRQPPLPRYGRRSAGLSTRTLSNEASNQVFPFDFSAEDDPVYRPPPRGGRYKRAVSSGVRSSHQDRPVRAGGGAEQRTNAVPPHSRIGRSSLSQAQTGSDSDPMADPRGV